MVGPKRSFPSVELYRIYGPTLYLKWNFTILSKILQCAQWAKCEVAKYRNFTASFCLLLQPFNEASGSHNLAKCSGHQKSGRNSLGARNNQSSNAKCPRRGHRSVGSQGDFSRPRRVFFKVKTHYLILTFLFSYRLNVWKCKSMSYEPISFSL